MGGLITAEQLAARWNTSLGYLANLRSQGKGCAYIKLNRRVMYREVDVKKYETDRRVLAEFVRPRIRACERTAVFALATTNVAADGKRLPAKFSN